MIDNPYLKMIRAGLQEEFAVKFFRPTDSVPGARHSLQKAVQNPWAASTVLLTDILRH